MQYINTYIHITFQGTTDTRLPKIEIVISKDRSDNKRSGGVLLAVKTDLLAHRRPDLEPLNSEILVCDFVSLNSFKITFCLCYRPLNSSLFIDYFECLLANLGETTGRICIAGDFNMPTIAWEYVIDLGLNRTRARQIKNCLFYVKNLSTLDLS